MEYIPMKSVGIDPSGAIRNDKKENRYILIYRSLSTKIFYCSL